MKIVSFILVLLFSASVVPASAQIDPTGIGVVNGYFIGPSRILIGADLRGADLRGANLRNARIEIADLSGADLSGADLSGADLTESDLSGADLTDANLNGADLGFANLSGANLSGADLSGANLNETDLSRVNLSGATLDFGDDFVTTTIWDTPDPRIAELEAQLAAMTAERDARPTQEQLAAVEAERDSRPTQAQLTAVEAERDARFTEAQIRSMSTNPTVGRNQAGNLQVDISFTQSSDLQSYIPLTVAPEYISIVDGKICVEFPPTNQDTFFFRLGVE